MLLGINIIKTNPIRMATLKKVQMIIIFLDSKLFRAFTKNMCFKGPSGIGSSSKNLENKPLKLSYFRTEIKDPVKIVKLSQAKNKAKK